MKNINTSTLLTLRDAHTLQKTGGLSFPMSEGQAEEALKIRLAPNAEGWRGKDERVIHLKVQEMTRRGSRSTDGLNQASDEKS